PGVHVSAISNGREARQRHGPRVQSTSEPAELWIPVTSTGMTPVGVADRERESFICAVRTLAGLRLERGPFCEHGSQAAPAARRVAPRPPQRGFSRVGHFKYRDGVFAISRGPERSEE
ncbi:MAG: hypothetical protein AAF732_20375, partial [Pseudomonadota bacterium]